MAPLVLVYRGDELPVEEWLSWEELQEWIDRRLGIAPEHQKLIAAGKVVGPDRLAAAADADASQPVRLLLLGTPRARIAAVAAQIEKGRMRPPPHMVSDRTLALHASDDNRRGRVHSLADLAEERLFAEIRPLRVYQHGTDKALAFLNRIASDAAIRHVMRHHRFRVGLLTELDPAAHTTVAAKTLGLNHNAGHVIELRLRTDDNDGFRHYNSVRNVMLHELTHNVYSEHNADFWTLFRRLEQQVVAFEKALDKGHVLDNATERYHPEDEQVDMGMSIEPLQGHVLGRDSLNITPNKSNLRTVMAEAVERRKNDGRKRP